MNPLQAERPLGPVVPNLATLLHRNAERFAGRTVFRARNAQGNFEGITWERFHADVLNIAHNLRHRFGFKPGDKLVIFSPNRLAMLELELAVMASGGIAVPIFAYFHTDTAELLIRHCGARFLAVAGELQLARLGGDLGLDRIFVMDPGVPQRFAQQHEFAELLAARNSTDDPLHVNAGADEICLNMY
ncbi:MAG TPA: AMP-binding protein, partial [Flavobacteriales bacterium]|nr:AMP-binding protein [Flavobacteriales bacterium]